MSKDFKNVFITFVLIALVFTTGSFVYKKNTQNNQALVDYNKVLSEIKNAEQIKTQQNILIAQLKKEQTITQQSQAKLLAQQQVNQKAAILAAQQQAAAASARQQIAQMSRRSRAS